MYAVIKLLYSIGVYTVDAIGIHSFSSFWTRDRITRINIYSRFRRMTGGTRDEAHWRTSAKSHRSRGPCIFVDISPESEKGTNPNERDLSPARYVTTIFVDFDSHGPFFRFRKAVERAALSSCWITWRVLGKNGHKLQFCRGEFASVSYNSIVLCDKYLIHIFYKYYAIWILREN